MVLASSLPLLLLPGLLLSAHMAFCTVMYTLSDGVRIDKLLPNAYVSYGCVPNRVNVEVALHFEAVQLGSGGCEQVEVAVYQDGLVKDDFNLLTTLCQEDEIRNYKASSTTGFFVVVHTHGNFTSGSLTVKVHSSAGVYTTNQRVLENAVN